VSGRQKVLLAVVAVLLVGLFVVAVAGRHPGDGDPGGSHALIARLAKLGGGQGVVPPDLVTAPCRRPDDTFQIAGTCTLHVDDPASLKLLVLRGHSPFRVTAPPVGDADYTATDDVTPGDDGIAEARIAVDKAGDVLVTCAGALSCALSLGDR
jgi:hypothetical protein